MKKFTVAAFVVVFTIALSLAGGVQTSNAAHGVTSQGASVSTTGVNGYDLVSYHKGAKPLRGNGNHVSEIHGVTYLFASKQNRKAFEANPEKYLPEYGGYCAYGAAVGKKFVGDPDVWKVVEGKLYLNLDNKIQGIWNKDIEGNIVKANAQWEKIETIPASQL